MPKYDIDGLKRKYEADESRRRTLLQAFLPFRDAFIELVRRFISDAETAGLRKVKQVNSRMESEQIIEYSSN